MWQTLAIEFTQQIFEREGNQRMGDYQDFNWFSVPCWEHNQKITRLIARLQSLPSGR